MGNCRREKDRSNSRRERKDRWMSPSSNPRSRTPKANRECRLRLLILRLIRILARGNTIECLVSHRHSTLDALVYSWILIQLDLQLPSNQDEIPG